VYANPLMPERWTVDYRIQVPDGEGKTKRDHVRKMLTNLVHCQHRSFQRVLMDVWHVTCDLMLLIGSLKNEYRSLHASQKMDDSGARSRTDA
jgi:hypothetical protein